MRIKLPAFFVCGEFDAAAAVFCRASLFKFEFQNSSKKLSSTEKREHPRDSFDVHFPVAIPSSRDQRARTTLMSNRRLSLKHAQGGHRRALPVRCRVGRLHSWSISQTFFDRARALADLFASVSDENHHRFKVTTLLLPTHE